MLTGWSLLQQSVYGSMMEIGFSRLR